MPMLNRKANSMTEITEEMQSQREAWKAFFDEVMANYEKNKGNDDDMNSFGDYVIQQQEDGSWICGADFDNSIFTKGKTEAEALQNMILALHHNVGVHCVQYMKIEKDLKAVKKARAVLAKYSEIVDECEREIQQSFSGAHTALKALSDALEAGDV